MTSEEQLMAYADGEFSAEERRQVEAALADDKQLYEAFEREKRFRKELSALYDPALEEEVPERLAGLLRAPRSQVVPLRSSLPSRRSALPGRRGMAAKAACPRAELTQLRFAARLMRLRWLPEEPGWLVRQPALPRSTGKPWIWAGPGRAQFFGRGLLCSSCR